MSSVTRTLALSEGEEPVSVTINKKEYKICSKVSPHTSLNTFLRNHINQRGTKVMCREGGCGACVVSARRRHPLTGDYVTFSINSCLTPIYSCHGWEITTIEGLQSTKDNLIQTRLVNFNGTQCGFCTPGFVMNMYSLMESKKKVTMKEVEQSFGGNICRCTGYRPILDAFKSLAVDASPELLKMCPDIEDIDAYMCNELHMRYTSGGKQYHKAVTDDRLDVPEQPNKALTSTMNGAQKPTTNISHTDGNWYKPTSLTEIYEIFQAIQNVPYMLVGGNTAQGIYRPQEEVKAYIDIKEVSELYKYTLEDTVFTLGAGISLNEAIEILQHIAESYDQYNYLALLADHIQLIANVPVRNTGTLAGNLSIKNQHHEFPSDLFVILETVGAKIEIGSSVHSVSSIPLTTFLNMNMNRKVIISIKLRPLSSSYILRTYKIMQRAENSHAYVNAGFLFNLKNGMVNELSMVYGGINPQFVHALNTEMYLKDKKLFDEDVLQNALQRLDTEVQPDHVLPDASSDYRKGLAKSLFYKFVLSLSPRRMNKRYASGGKILKRELSSGKQDYQTHPEMWPLTKNVTKLEASVQASGEAEYVDDIPSIPGELFAQFVLTTQGPGTLVSVDPSAALQLQGVVTFIGAKNVPGKNNFAKFDPPIYLLNDTEEIFCSGKIFYAGQSVGLVVAETEALAYKAAALVKLEYADITTPKMTINDVISSGDSSRIITEMVHEPTAKTESAYTINGQFTLGGQYHFTMELQTCLCVPIEDGLDVYPSSMWMDCVQRGIAECLDIQESKINIKVRRLGGSYGCKISRNNLLATACAIAAYQLNKPVRLAIRLETNMETIGKRHENSCVYEVGFDATGKIKNMKCDLYQNAGSNLNESVVIDFLMPGFTNCYDDSSWSYTGKSVITDGPSHTYMRAPGTFEGIVCIENIMEHIARHLDLDPYKVRLANMDPTDNNIPQMLAKLQTTANFNSRKQEMDKFNKRNRWLKKGISIVPMKFPIIYFGYYHSLVSIYHVDGTVSVSHVGIEIGQGINTKVAQTCAHFLGIPVSMIKIKPSNNLTSPNGQMTGASITSETCVYAAMRCCQELVERLAPIRNSMPMASWEKQVQEAYRQNIDMCATYMFTSKEVKEYNVYGVTVAEVLVDILTGQLIVSRVDIMEDAGRSLNPVLDVGQVEGAFMQGLGLMLTEELIYSPESGQLLTNRTWNYKPPTARDIPVDLRVTLQHNSSNPNGVLRSKATGEPALVMSCAVLFALRYALHSARKDAGNTDKWYTLNAPATPENIFLKGLANHKQYQLYTK